MLRDGSEDQEGGKVSHEKTLESGSLAPNQRLYAFERAGRPQTRKPAPRPCEYCKTIFTPKYENPLKPARHCSPKCRAATWRDEQKKDRRIEALTDRVGKLESRISTIESKLNIK